MHRKKLALVLTGAVALASGAYAIGSQAGGGTAAGKSGSTPRASHEREGPGLRTLATELGVSASQLQAALDAVRKQKESSEQGRKSELATALARQLGVSPDQVTSALRKLRVQKEGRHGDQTSEHNDGGTAEGRGQGQGGPAEAGERHAGQDTDGTGGKAGGRHGGADGDFAAGLARALGVGSAKVKAALKTVQAQERSQWRARRGTFAKALAQRLNIPVSRVSAAFASSDRRRHGH